MIPTEIKRALDNGITQEEIIEISTTLAFFIGWKAASEAVQGIIQIFRGLYPGVGSQGLLQRQP